MSLASRAVTLQEAQERFRTCTRYVLTTAARRALRHGEWMLLDGVPHVIAGEYVLHFRRQEGDAVFAAIGFASAQAHAVWKAQR